MPSIGLYKTNLMENKQRNAGTPTLAIYSRATDTRSNIADPLFDVHTPA